MKSQHHVLWGVAIIWHTATKWLQWRNKMSFYIFWTYGDIDVRTSCKHSFRKNLFIIFMIVCPMFSLGEKKIQSINQRSRVKNQHNHIYSYLRWGGEKSANNHVAGIRSDPHLSRSKGGPHRTSCCRGLRPSTWPAGPPVLRRSTASTWRRSWESKPGSDRKSVV